MHVGSTIFPAPPRTTTTSRRSRRRRTAPPISLLPSTATTGRRTRRVLATSTERRAAVATSMMTRTTFTPTAMATSTPKEGQRRVISLQTRPLKVLHQVLHQQREKHKPPMMTTTMTSVLPAHLHPLPLLRRGSKKGRRRSEGRRRTPPPQPQPQPPLPLLTPQILSPRHGGAPSPEGAACGGTTLQASPIFLTILMSPPSAATLGSATF